MSDLLQRLREWASEPACYEVPPPSLLHEAADTIARLTAERDVAVAAERERCCRIVAVQRDDDRYDVARRTILAIRAGDDFHDVDDDVLRT